MASGMVLVAPVLGTPASGVATNLTGTAASLTAGAVSTIAGLAPNTATTQATQAAITSAANLATVGTIGTGVWQGTAINDTYIDTINNANKVALTALDIDGGTDVGADIVDGDLIIIDDGAGGTNRKATMSRLKTYMGDVSGGSTLGNIQVGITAAGELDTSSGNLIIDSAGGTTTLDDNVIVSGNLTVSGTQTIIDSTTLNIADNIIELNAGTSDGGLYVKETAGGNATGSMLWDVSSNRWFAGVAGSEKNVVLIDSTDTLTNKTLTTPTIGSFTNATHTHANAAGGGVIALGTATSGNYVGTITGGTGITSTAATSGEGTTHSLSVDASQTQITAVGTIATGVWQGTDVGVAYGGTGASSLSNLITLGDHTTGNYVGTITGGTGITSTAATSGEGTTHSLSVDASQTQITSVGTIGTGVWNGTAVASAYLDADTAHLSTTQTFSGAKTFSSTLNTANVSGSSTSTGSFGAGYIDNKLGIGTTSPAQMLEIAGDVRIKDARSLFFKRHGDNYAWRIRNESAADGSTYGFNGSNDLIFEVVGSSHTNADPSDSSHTLYASSANTLVLQEAGQVGIKVADPQYTLDVGGAINASGNITVGGTVDGIDIAARDAILTSTTTTAGAALPKAGGAMTGAITTNSTFDGVDIATRDGVLTSTTTTANAALPKSGGTMSGNIAMGGGNISGGGTITGTTGTFSSTLGVTGIATFSNNVLPAADNSKDLGSASKRWANIYSADVHLSNEGAEGNEIDGTTGNWTIQEGDDDLYLLNRKNGKKYRFKLEEIK